MSRPSRCCGNAGVGFAENGASLENRRAGARDEIRCAFNVAVLIVLPAVFDGKEEGILVAQHPAIVESSAVAFHVQGHGLAYATSRVFKGDVFGGEIVALYAYRGRGISSVLRGITGIVAVGDDDAFSAFAEDGDIGFLGGHQQLLVVGAVFDKDGSRHLHEIAHGHDSGLNIGIIAAAVERHPQTNGHQEGFNLSSKLGGGYYLGLRVQAEDEQQDGK